MLFKVLKPMLVGGALGAAACASAAQEGPAPDALPQSWIEAVRDQHSLTLPDWGPYTKRYVGISHVPPANPGLRFDLSVFPGLYNRKATAPNVLFESDTHPWEATPDFAYFSFRHEVEWKDQVYADISYTRLDGNRRLIRAELVNNSDLPQNLELHLVASVNFPTPDPGMAALPEGAIRVGAADYKDMRFAQARPSDTLVYDGKRRGEIRADGFVGGSGLGEGFGATAGDTASYEFKLERPIASAHLLVRYRMSKGDKTVIRMTGIHTSPETFEGTGALATKDLALGDLPVGTRTFVLVSAGGGPIELDGFVLVSSADAPRVAFTTKHWEPRPQMTRGPKANSLILKYPDIDDCYGIAWSFEGFQVRQFLSKDLDVILPTMAQNHVKDVFRGDGEGHFADVFLRPIPMAAHSRRIVYATVCNGTRNDVIKALSGPDRSAADCEAAVRVARSGLTDLSPASQGAGYRFSQERMAATLLCNVVYPVYTQGSYIKHNTPGRWWDSLYTWDSGFIGLGLDELDTRRSFECLNAYLTPPGAQSAFIHHGSMVPVQHYLFLDLWNRTQSRALLEYCYPRLRQYYEFYLGRLGSSTLGKFKSGLLSSFDYFYNSGGWDDYPPQKFSHDHEVALHMAPVVNSAQGIRIAKIMLMAANALGLEHDADTYRADIHSLSHSLETYAWDEASGYFGYVEHDASGNPVGILRYGGGVNYNLGLDGVYPLVAGAGTPAQTARMLAELKSPAHLWSRAGLSAVDQSAPYFRNDGYWNGTVWMPHQWFFWKAMLDLGEADFAWEIAKRGLDVWKTETDATYYSMEHFLIETGRGAGWHEFGGLSTPVLKWYSAYCRPGTVTTGFNVWIVRQHFDAGNSGYEADLKILPQEGTRTPCTLVACLNPGRDYRATWKGKAVEARARAKGLLEISIPAGDTAGTISLSPLP